MKLNKQNHISGFLIKIYDPYFKNALSFFSNLIVKNYWLVGLIILLIYFLPYIILGENSYFKVHDNLDGEIVYRVLLANEGVFLESQIPQIMNGLPRFCLPSGFNFTVWLFAIFTPLKAYLINDFIARLVGFIGLYLLLTSHFLEKQDKCKILAFFIAISFSLIPFYNIYGISVTGQPIILFVFLNLLNRETKWWNYALIIAFVLYSSFVLSGFFICIMLGIIFIIDTIRNKRVNQPYFIGLLLLGFGYLIVEYQLMESFLFDNEFISHRTEFNPSKPSLKAILIRSKNLFFETANHTGSLKTGIIIISTILSFFVVKKIDKKMIYLILTIASILFIYTIKKYVTYWLGNDFTALKVFQWDRFYFVLPSLWITLFAVSLSTLFSSKYLKFLIPIFIFFQIKSTTKNDGDYQTNILHLKGNVVDWAPSFTQFYAKEIFKEIDNYIQKNKKDYRIVSIGIHPSIAQFNGFYTLDSYQNNYPLGYKHQFRKIIEKELNKNEKIKSKFDGWGNRCYLYTAEYGTEFIDGKDKRATKGTEINKLEINTAILREMGCRYIFSANKINNYRANNLTFEKMFTHSNSYWKIYLYKIEN